MSLRSTASAACANLLEPPQLTELFLRFPPEGFAVGNSGQGMPFFRTDFDLLTTLEADSARRLKALPLYRLWSRLLRVSACFAGSTVSEYAPLPAGVDPETLLLGIREAGGGDTMTIIKDLPSASPLLSHEENQAADRLADKARAMGFLEMEGQALAYVPIDFHSTEEYLERLSSGRRKDLRRKMKKRSGLELSVLASGDPLFFRQDMLDEMYAMYLEVFAQSDIHFDKLSPEFFTALLQSVEMEGIVLCYRQSGHLIGYNICFIHDNRLVDKYVGFRYPQAREWNLYFISWLINLETALEKGLDTYIAGWTDPEVKASLGARFAFTRHLVWIRNPLLRSLLSPFRHLFEGDARTLETLR